MSTIITALIVLGFIALVIGLLMFVHKRDQKREAAKKINIP
jgi:heme/copper-type cytochrome/quinol oxidase subunit 4